MSWIWVFGYLLSALSIWIGFSARFGGMKSSTKHLFAVIGFFVLLLMIGLTLDALFHWWSKFPKAVLGILGILIVLERIARITIARKRGGVLLLDLGRIPVPDMIINVFAGLGLAWFALSDLLQIVHGGVWTFHDISLQILGISISIAVMIQGVGKRSILARGVFHGTGLSAWEQIVSYSWERESTTSSILVLYKRPKVPLFKLVTLSVRVEQTPEVDEILHQHNISSIGQAPKAEL
jgi:hypothetical protein